jgi:glyoxylase-like metal-dependent hydrolase (beta-lactamase superfamily II)
MQSGPRLYVFDCGETQMIPKDSGYDQKSFKNYCYLIDHPKGKLLWESGLGDQFANNQIKKDSPSAVFKLRINRLLSNQLKEIKFSPKDINYIGFSHMFPDHTGNANMFSRSTLILQKEEYEAAFGTKASQYSFSPKTYQKLKNNPVIKLNDDFDLFNDGSVIIKRALTGHSPGHQVLYLRLAKQGSILLSGDLYHFTKDRSDQRIPAVVFNNKQSLATIRRIEKFVKENKVQVWIQKDLKKKNTIRLSPMYYE